jgi:hypothetical protein
MQEEHAGVVALHSDSLRFDLGLADATGHRRSMEDAMAVVGSFRGRANEDFFGVYDGHGGAEVAGWLADKLHEHVERALSDAEEGRGGTLADGEAALVGGFAAATEVPPAPHHPHHPAVQLNTNAQHIRIIHWLGTATRLCGASSARRLRTLGCVRRGLAREHYSSFHARVPTGQPDLLRDRSISV